MLFRLCFCTPVMVLLASWSTAPSIGFGSRSSCRARWRVRNPVRRRDPGIVGPPHEGVPDIHDIGTLDGGGIEPHAITPLHLQPAGRSFRAKDGHEAVV